jgi:hypothetical protein
MMKAISKNPFWHKAIFTALLAGCFNLLEAQTENDWKVYTTKDSVTLSYRFDNCSGHNMIFFKFENTTTTRKQVMCHIVVESPTLTIPLMPQIVQLKANETKAGSCTSELTLRGDMRTITNPTLKMLMMNVH